MPMSNNGLSKLAEELGELMQVVGKKLAYPNGEHPDGKGDLDDRMVEEMGDVLAAMSFVSDTHNLDFQKVQDRSHDKWKLYHKWHADLDN